MRIDAVLRLCGLSLFFVPPTLTAEVRSIFLRQEEEDEVERYHSVGKKQNTNRPLDAANELPDVEPLPLQKADFKPPALRQNHQRLLKEALRMLQNTRRLPLVEIVLQTFILDNFEGFLSHGSVANEISGDGPFTVLMPYNPAFEKLDEKMRENLTNRRRLWDAHLRDLLRGHFIDGDLTVDSLGVTQTIPTRNGVNVVVTRILGTSRVRVNGFQALANYNATNGMAYMLTDVIIPPWYTRNLLELAIGLTGQFSELTSYVVRAGLESALTNSNTSVTVLGPNNAAFQALPQETVDVLQSEDGIPLLREILAYHIVTEAVFPTSGLFPEIYFRTTARNLVTAQGGILVFSPGDPPTIQGEVNQAMIIATDVPASNGLVHEVDTVLLLSPPSEPTPTPTTAPGVIPAPPPKPSEWTQNGTPFASPVSVELGSSVSTAGDVAVVGAPATPDSENNRAGSALVFERGIDGEWAYVEQVSNVLFREFGAAIDMAGPNSFVVGAPLTSSGGIVRGAALYYRRQEGQWRLFGGVFRPPRIVQSAFSNFGAAVATSLTDRVIIGAPDYDFVGSSGATEEDNGRVFTYRIESVEEGFESFGQDLYGEAPDDRFGAAVDMSPDGEQIVVGAPGTVGQSRGKVYIYEEDTPLEWTESFMIIGPDESNFGATVQFVGENAGIVATGAPNFGNNQGMIRLFERTSQGWQRLGGDIVGQQEERLGTSLEGSDQFLVVGTGNGDFRAFEILSDGWIELLIDIDAGSNRPPITAVSVSDTDIVVTRQGETASTQTVTFYELLDIPPPPPTVAPTVTMAPTPMIPTISPVALQGELSNLFTVNGGNYSLGASITSDGDYVAISAPGVDAVNSPDVGFIFTYSRGGDIGWTELANFADTTLRSLGSAIDLSYFALEDRYGLAVGAAASVRTAEAGDVVGAAQYRELTIRNQFPSWTIVGSTVRPPNSLDAVDSEFGAAVAAAAGPRFLIVGAPLFDDSTSGYVDCGRAFTYAFFGNDFRGIGPALRGTSAGDRFGSSVAVTTRGDRLVVGAPGADGASSGTFYIYSRSGDTWKQIYTATGPDSSSNLGATVAFLDDTGDTVAVGAPNFEGNRGLIRVYQRDPDQGTWSQLGNDFVGSPGEFVGRTASGSLGLFVIGTSDGKLRSYRYVSNAWEALTDELTLSPVAPVDSVAVNGLNVFAGRTQSGDRVGFFEVV